MQDKQGTKYNLADLTRRLLPFLPEGSTRQLSLIFVGTIFTALAEVLFAGMMALFAASIVNPNEVMQSAYVHKAATFLALPDQLLQSKNMLILLGLSSVLAVAIKNAARGGLNYYQDVVTTKISAYFGRLMMENMLSRPYRWLAGMNSSDILTNISWARIMAQFIQGILMALCEMIIVSFMLTALLLLDPLSVLFVLIFLTAICILIYVKIKKWSDIVASQATEINRNANRQSTKAIHGYKDVKVFGCQEFFVEEFDKEMRKLPPLMARQKLLNASPGLVLETMGITLLCLITVYMLFVQEGSSAKVTGSLIFMGVTVWRGLPSFVRALSQFTSIRNILPMVESSLRNLEETPIPASGKAEDCPAPGMELRHSLRFDGVGLIYEQSRQPALSQVNFELKAGEALGIIGKSGAGKSTLVDILIGLMPPDRGRVLLDETELDQGLIAQWLRNVGYVSQEPYIYDGTLLQNIAFGCDEASVSREWILECCRMAAVTDFLNDLPDGLDTRLGERGTRLSGGQRQRVVIARALYKKPSLIVFDEATSSLDTKSEAEIQKTMYDLKGTLTMVIVAHRLSTVENCDRLLWLEKGQVVMDGAPDRILSLYRDAMTSLDREQVSPIA